MIPVPPMLTSRLMAVRRRWGPFSLIRFGLALTDLAVSRLFVHLTEYKEAFALFDKKGTGHIARESLGDLLRALGQNPTQAEVAELAGSAPKDSELQATLSLL